MQALPIDSLMLRYGYYASHNGAHYVGQFHRGAFTGFGVLVDSRGNEYKGQLRYGMALCMMGLK